MSYSAKGLFLCCVVLALATAACSSGDPLALPAGNVNILLTDAPLDLSTVSAVNVTVTGVRLYPAAGDDAATSNDEGGMPMHLHTTDGDGEGFNVNLLDYQNGQTVMLASLDAPEGDYRKLRLEIVSAELVHDDDGDPDTPDIAEPIFISSEKVMINAPFSLSNGDGIDVTLDFDAGLSVKVNQTQGQHPYILRPVINVVQVSRR